MKWGVPAEDISKASNECKVIQEERRKTIEGMIRKSVQRKFLPLDCFEEEEK